MHAWWGGPNERGVSEEVSVDVKDWKGVKWPDAAQNAEKLWTDVDPVYEPLVSIILRSSCVGNKYRPKKDCGIR